MIPVETRGAAWSYFEPEGWDPERDGRCGVLSVRQERIGRHVHHISTWMPSPEECRRLAAGAVIELTCVGIQPPVAMKVLGL